MEKKIRFAEGVKEATDIVERVDEIIKVDMDWMNAMDAKIVEPDYRFGYEGSITREMYDEYGDHPKVYLDTGTDSWLGGHIVAWRLIWVACTPFHDEGGTAELTGFFAGIPDFDSDSDQLVWELRDVVREFDMQRDLIYRDRVLQGVVTVVDEEVSDD